MRKRGTPLKVEIRERAEFLRLLTAASIDEFPGREFLRALRDAHPPSPDFLISTFKGLAGRV